MLGVDIDADRPFGQVVEAVQDLGEASGVTVLVERHRARRTPPCTILSPEAACRVGRRRRLDLRVVGARPRRRRRGGSRGDSGGAAERRGSRLRRSATSRRLVPAAIGIFLVSFADGILPARSFAGKHGQNIRANQELLAFSGVSAAAGITQGFPLGASGSRTTVNDQMGARTQIAGLVAAGATALVLLFFTEPIGVSAVGGARSGDRLGCRRPRQRRSVARAHRCQPLTRPVSPPSHSWASSRSACCRRS